MATDESTGELSIRKVMRKFVRAAAPIVAITIATANGETTLRTTEEHPFYVVAESSAAGASTEQDGASAERPSSPHAEAPSNSMRIGREAAARSGWVAAHVLKPGDVVDSLSGPGRVLRIQFTNELRTVYNFEVEGLHDYRVGADGILVHNRGTCAYPDHHAWPKFLRGPDSQNFVSMPRHLHERFHGDLYSEMAKAGIHKPGAMTWEDYFRRTPEHYDTAINTLYTLSARYDAQFLRQSGGYDKPRSDDRARDAAINHEALSHLSRGALVLRSVSPLGHCAAAPPCPLLALRKVA